MPDAADFPDLLPPAPRPCKSCPYRRDVPAQVWHNDEYAKLAGYDKHTAEQPLGVFRCHQNGVGDPRSRVCAGWAHVHGRNPPGHELLALRMAVTAGLLSLADARATAAYSTDVPCFASGLEAAGHGMHGEFTADSEAMAAALVRRRPQTTRRAPRRRR